jgi:hypothetical protein
MPFRERREGAALGRGSPELVRFPWSSRTNEQRVRSQAASHRKSRRTATPTDTFVELTPPTADGHNVDSAHRLAGAGGLNFLFAFLFARNAAR